MEHVYEAPEQKILRYKKPDGSIPVNGANLLFCKYSFFNFTNRIDIRKYFVTKFDQSKNPEINSRLMPGKKGLSLTFPEALELVKALRAMLQVAKYCSLEEMQPDQEMLETAMSITDLGGSPDAVANRKRHISDGDGSTLLLDDKSAGSSDVAKISVFECSQPVD